MLQDTVTVLAVLKYDFHDDLSNRQVRGCKITFIDNHPIEDKQSKGMSVIVLQGDYAIFDQLENLPTKYQLGFSQKIVKDKPTLRVVSAQKV